MQRPHKVTAAMDPAPREGGCWPWRTQRKMALELLPPRLGPSKVQWMNNSLSTRFCSQGWPRSPFCNDLVRVEGWRGGGMSLCHFARYQWKILLPYPTASPTPFQRVVDTSWKQSLPWSQRDKYIKTQNMSVLHTAAAPCQATEDGKMSKR